MTLVPKHDSNEGVRKVHGKDGDLRIFSFFKFPDFFLSEEIKNLFSFFSLISGLSGNPVVYDKLNLRKCFK